MALEAGKPRRFSGILTVSKEDEIIFSDSATSQKLLDLLEPILRCEKLKNVPKIIFNHCSACDDIFLDASANYDLNMFRQIFHKLHYTFSKRFL